ncbi:hypothetical protein GGP41_003206 [Bipolaris sorokiniana]|uniref:Uncharacterized protein n=1 Tax=Cochliobolus sativus TaxID=45130 RepID=A0A8H6DSK7_COCSA|nr:hypothetical protein GGP41_003206 [Bipolaris sorokiniana]
MSSVSFIDLDKFESEALNSCGRWTTTPLDNADAPSLDRALLVGHDELSSIKPPSALDHIMAEVGVVGPIEETNSMLNRYPAILGEGNSKLDHVRCLRVTELCVVTLISVNLEDVNRHIDSLTANLLRHPDHWNTTHDGDAVLLLEVGSD